MPKPKPEGTSTLARRWSAPTDLPIGSVGRPLHCVATTYTFRAGFLETELLPRFLGLRFDEAEVERAFIVERERALGTARVAVLVDCDHVDAAQTTLRWDQLAVRVPGGVQHAKVTLLAWENCVRILVASANLTRPGYRRNREMASILDFYDHPTSSPRALALEIIAFLEECVPWIRASRGAIGRLRESLASVRNRLRRWKDIASEFGPRERPQLAFASTLPRRNNVPVRSPLTVLFRMWGARRVSRVTVMTPFVGETEGPVDSVINQLMKLPRTRGAIGSLVVPGCPSEDDPKRQVVSLPRRFLDAWSEAWECEVAAVPTYVVPLFRGEEPQRDLHAKAILLSDDSMTLLMCGSSNFSPHGMGIGVANIEANLCFLDAHLDKRDGHRLHERLPVDWERDLCENAKWPEFAKPPEEEMSAGDRLPALFVWAAFDQQNAELTLAIDPSQTKPTAWRIRLPGDRKDELSPIADASTPRTSNDRIVVPLPLLRGTSFAGLEVEWNDEAGQSHRAILPVHVENLDTLVPPEEFRSLSVDAIINSLLSGREPEELIEALARSHNGESTAAQRDSLRAVDTTRYMLYRTRRFGRALSTLGERVSRTLHTREAMRYRLRQDPLGPWALADAVLREWRPLEGNGMPAMDFALSELALVLSYAGRRVRLEREPGDPDLRMLFAEVIRDILDLRHQAADGKQSPTRLAEYVRAVEAECVRLNSVGGSDAG